MKTETKKAQHTPGPWEVYGHNQIRETVSPDRDLVCEVPMLGAGHLTPDAKANAALIAAAPDHDKNAKWADNLFSRFLNAESPAFRESLEALGLWAGFKDWIEANRAAIAKAEGR